MLENVSEAVLNNGLKVVCLQKRSAPVVSVQVWYRTGSVNEHDGIRGMSHFLEHMMFRGSENVPPEEHARRINDVGGHCNAFTAEDVTAYTNSVPRDHLEMVFELEADRMERLAITGEILETERRVIVEEYHGYMNNPLAKAFLQFRKQFYGSHPYALGPLGRLEDIERISVQDCVEYYRSWYTASNAVVVVVGDFGSDGEICGLTEKHFGKIGRRAVPSSANPPGGAPADAETRVRDLVQRVEFDVPMQIIGFPAPPSCHVDALALDILQQVMSSGETGRLRREVVRREGAAVLAGGMNLLLRLSGMSLLFAAFTPDMPAAGVLRSLQRQVRRVRDEGITSEEMQKVKNASLSSRVFEMYSAEHLCQRLGFSETVDGNYGVWVSRLAALEKLDREQLVEAARRYWQDDRRWTLYLKPHRVRPILYAVGFLRRLVARAWLVK